MPLWGLSFCTRPSQGGGEPRGGGRARGGPGAPPRPPPPPRAAQWITTNSVTPLRTTGRYRTPPTTYTAVPPSCISL
jgi:hypothetical protein